jgi:hypothetical protein
VGFQSVSTTGRNDALMRTLKQNYANYGGMLQDGKMTVLNTEPGYSPGQGLPLERRAHTEWTNLAMEGAIAPNFRNMVDITQDSKGKQVDVVNASISINLPDAEVNRFAPGANVHFKTAESDPKQLQAYRQYFETATVTDPTTGQTQPKFSPQTRNYANLFESVAEGTEKTPGIPVIVGAGNEAGNVNAISIIEGSRPGSQVLSVVGMDNDNSFIPPEASTVDIHVPLQPTEPTANRNPDGSIQVDFHAPGLQPVTLNKERHTKLEERLNTYLGRSVNDREIKRVADLSPEQQADLKALGLNGAYIGNDDLRNIFLGSGGHMHNYVIATYNADSSGRLVSADLPTLQGTSIAAAITTGKVVEARIQEGIEKGEIQSP